MTVEIIIIKPTHYAGERREVGQRLQLAPIAAADLVRTGKATIADAADAQAVRAAVAAQVARLVAEPVGLHPHRGGWGQR